MSDAPLRVSLLTYSTKPRGGVVHTLSLAEALAADGHDVTVWSLARGGDTGFFRPVDPAVRLRLVPFPDLPGEGVGERILRSIDVLRAAFDPDGADIVHAQDCITANAVGRCVRTVHHLDHFTTPELAACHERAIVAPYAHVCVSHAVTAELRDGWGVEATVIPNGVDAHRFATAGGRDRAAVRARERWRAELGRYVLATGGIEPRKGTLDLVEAMALVQREQPDVRLVLAGGETLFDYRDYREAVLARAAELGVEPVVLGVVAHDELPGLTAAAAVFAFPSTKEGFGLAAMEALAAGVPLVVRDLPVLREVFGSAARFGSHVAGLSAGLLDSLGDVSSNCATAGRALAVRHTWAASAESHVAFYRSLV